jgi:hypothetical protein
MFLEGRALSRPPLEWATTRLRKSTAWQAERGPPTIWGGTADRRPAVDPTALPTFKNLHRAERIEKSTSVALSRR